MKRTEKKILVVDDDEGIRTSLARILRAEGHHVQVACDGLEAIGVCEDYRPDLLLSDIRMPGMDGVETFRQLREQIPELTVIFMTAYSASEMTKEAARCGALSVLSKPIDIENLVRDQVNMIDS